MKITSESEIEPSFWACSKRVAAETLSPLDWFRLGARWSLAGGQESAAALAIAKENDLAWLAVSSSLLRGNPDIFACPDPKNVCAVREIQRLQACERHMKALQDELSLAKGKAGAASPDHAAATAEASAANESAAVAGVKLAQLWNALAANTQEQALSRVQALNRFFNLYTDLRSSMTEVEHAFRSADMVKGSEG